MSVRRVVVTGIGAVTPLAATAVASWQRLLSGECGIRKISHMPVDDLACQIAGIVPGVGEPDGLNLDEFVPSKTQRQTDRFIHLGLVASEEAVKDANLGELTSEEQERVGVMLGSGIGGLDGIAKTALTLEQEGPRRISPFFIPACLINLLSGHVAIKYGFKGPNHSVVTACSTGAHAIGDAAKLIKMGYADVMVAGGAEAAVCRIGIAGFAALRALATKFNDNPKAASRPWDKERDGFVMGEGAGVVVLEEYERAKARGATIYGELLGYGLTGDAHHITAPDGDGAKRAMRNAIADAGLEVNQIDYINAHGTSTPVGDVMELNAVKSLFGDHAYQLAMSSTKSAVGHLLGAAGSVEAIFSILALHNQIVPPTLNLDDPDEGCDLNLVAHKSQQKELRYVMSNSFGFGGTNASLVIGKLEE